MVRGCIVGSTQCSMWVRRNEVPLLGPTAAATLRACRALFERATHLALPPKKMKFLFKRYLEYEKREGSAASVEHVKRRALEFVEQAALAAGA